MENESKHLESFTNPDLVNPFSETTRRARKMLILISFFGFATNWAGLIPKKIVPLDIELEPTNLYALLILTLLALLYFLFSFWIYANADLARNQILLRISKNLTRERIEKNKSDQSKASELARDGLLYSAYRSLPKSVINQSILKAEIEEQLNLDKGRNYKIFFDKFIPLIAGSICLIYLSLKLFKLDIFESLLVLLSLKVSAIYFSLFYLFQKKKKVKKKIGDTYKVIKRFILLNNLKFLDFQMRISKSTSWLHKRAKRLRKELPLKELDSYMSKVDKRAKTLKKQKGKQ